MSAEAHTSTEYIKHHLQNLTYGQLPAGYQRGDGEVLQQSTWTLAHTAQEAKDMGFMAINVDTMGFSILLGALFLFFFILFHISQMRWGKACIVLLLAVVLVGQGYSYVKHRSEGIVSNRYGLTVYRGIPIPFFDVLFFPDGAFRLVDKKHHFNYRDRTFLLKQKTDIVLIGSGRDGKGGGGFAEAGISQFTFNPFTQRGTQVIILRTPEACRVFNRLRREGKNVLFVLHNTC